MRAVKTVVAAVWMLFCGLAVANPGQGPAFSCAQPSGEVEQLICKDPALAALDRQLDTVYKAAAAKASGSLAGQLRGEQRGWIKGRNDCWKANGQPTWITATWTVGTVAGCIDAMYRMRISELQAVWRLLPPKSASYACQGQPANEVVVNAFATDPATLRVERGDRTKTLWQVGAPDAGTYEGQNVSLVFRGDALTLNWLDTGTGRMDELGCKAR